MELQPCKKKKCKVHFGLQQIVSVSLRALRHEGAEWECIRVNHSVRKLGSPTLCLSQQKLCYQLEEEQTGIKWAPETDFINHKGNIGRDSGGTLATLSDSLAKLSMLLPLFEAARGYFIMGTPLRGREDPCVLALASDFLTYLTYKLCYFILLLKLANPKFVQPALPCFIHFFFQEPQ